MPTERSRDLSDMKWSRAAKWWWRSTAAGELGRRRAALGAVDRRSGR